MRDANRKRARTHIHFKLSELNGEVIRVCDTNTHLVYIAIAKMTIYSRERHFKVYGDSWAIGNLNLE